VDNLIERKVVVYPLRDVADEDRETGLFAVYYEPFNALTDKVVYINRGQLTKKAEDG